ncbi:hypothetical protein ACJQWK_00082 [Exserohilum turcicum]
MRISAYLYPSPIPLHTKSRDSSSMPTPRLDKGKQTPTIARTQLKANNNVGVAASKSNTANNLSWSGCPCLDTLQHSDIWAGWCLPAFSLFQPFHIIPASM